MGSAADLTTMTDSLHSTTRIKSAIATACHYNGLRWGFLSCLVDKMPAVNLSRVAKHKHARIVNAAACEKCD